MKKIILLLLGLSFLQAYAQRIENGDIFAAEGFYSFSEGGKHGIMFHGEIVLYPQYEQLSISPFGFNKEGCIGTYKSGEKFGLIIHGKPITKPLFDEAKVIWMSRDFKKEKIKGAKLVLAMVKEKGKWGITDIEGNYLVEPKYDFISDKIYKWGDNRSREASCNIFFLAMENEESYIIDLLGRTVLTNDKIEKIVESYYNSYYRDSKTYTTIYRTSAKTESKLNKKDDRNIHNIIEKAEKLTKEYNTPFYSLNHIDNIEIKGKEGHIQIFHSGKPVTSSTYDKVYSQENGVIRVVKNNKYGLVDCIRGEIIPCKYDYISSFSDNEIATIMDRGFEGKLYKSGYTTLAYDLLQGDFKTACMYAPDNLYLRRKAADKLFINEQYKQAYELYDMILAKIKEKNISSIFTERIQNDRNLAYNYSIGNYPQEESEATSGWDIALGFLNSVAEVTNTIGQIKSGNNTSSPSNSSLVVNKNSNRSTNKVNKNTNNSRGSLTGNYATLDRTYSNWESRLIDMHNNPNKYSKMDFSDIPTIQKKMKDIREKITSMGGTRVQSKWETWKP